MKNEKNYNWENYIQILLKNNNISDDVLNNIFTFTSYCLKCYKNNKKILLYCNCYNLRPNSSGDPLDSKLINKKKCGRNKCNKVCNNLSVFDINILNQKYNINFEKGQQINKNNTFIKRNILRINKNEIYNMINDIQGISCLKRYKDQ